MTLWGSAESTWFEAQRIKIIAADVRGRELHVGKDATIQSGHFIRCTSKLLQFQDDAPEKK